MDKKPVILALCCHYCAYAAADLAGSMRLQYPATIRVLRLPCTGKVEENYIDTEGKFIWLEGEAVCNFGKKHRGRRLKDIVIEDPEYLNWIASADFSTEVKEIAINALNGEFPEPPKPYQSAEED